MPALVQAPTTFVVEITIERNGASEKHLEDYLHRQIKKAMEHAQFSTPAASKLVSMTITTKTEK